MNKKVLVRAAAKSSPKVQASKRVQSYTFSFRSSSTLCRIAAQDNQEIDRALSTLKRITQD